MVEKYVPLKFQFPREVKNTVQLLYSDLKGVSYYKQILRTYICPFHLLVDEVPVGSRVLDIGCGSGLFLGLLAVRRKIDQSVGFDADKAAINVAQKMSQTIDGNKLLRFEHCDIRDNWPDGLFDVVSLIDVMHHISPSEQRNVLMMAVGKLAPDGILLYKDMVDKPLHRAWANRLHDLIVAKQWINYLPMEVVRQVADECGLKFIKNDSLNMLWYGHEWIVFRNDKT